MEIEEIIEKKKTKTQIQLLCADVVEKPETRNMAKSELHKQSMDFSKNTFC